MHLNSTLTHMKSKFKILFYNFEKTHQIQLSLFS